MRDLLGSGLSWMTQQLRTHAARPVVYRRASMQLVVYATLGRKDFEADTLEGRLYFRANDFLIPADSLAWNGQAVLPERGDLIDVAFGAETVTFEVLAQDNLPPWEYADPHQSMLRIHTKRVS
jgi:hypothetical protein